MAQLSDSKIKERVGRIPERVKQFTEAAPDVARIVEDTLKKDMEMSQSEIVQHAVRYASIHYKEFYEYLKTAHKADPLELEYVSPGAITLAGERQLACAVIGIGAVWIWVVVSPWTTARAA